MEMKAHTPASQSFFLKCFDLSYQSASVMSAPLLPVSPRFLIKARWLDGCPWSVRKAYSKLRHKSGIQRPSSLAFFWMFCCSYQWNRIESRNGFRGHHLRSLRLCMLLLYNCLVCMWFIYIYIYSFPWNEKLIGRKWSRNEANHIDFSISFI